MRRFSLQIAPPAVLPVPGRYGHYRRGAGLAVFLNSRGEITAFDSTGAPYWQVGAPQGTVNTVNIDVSILAFSGGGWAVRQAMQMVTTRM